MHIYVESASDIQRRKKKRSVLTEISCPVEVDICNIKEGNIRAYMHTWMNT